MVVNFKFFIGILFLFAYTSVCIAKDIEVHAVDYPPYTSPTIQNNGVAFDSLYKLTLNSDISIKPRFLPPARVGLELSRGNWCLSFVPPAIILDTHERLTLKDTNIDIVFVRKNRTEPFKWNKLSELAGLKLGFLRTYKRESILTNAIEESDIVIVGIETLQQGLELLDKERVDILLADKVSIEYLASILELPKGNFQYSENVIEHLTLGVWLNLKCDAALKVKSISNGS